MQLHAVILAGGSGTRLWPLSRKFHPKQFLKLFGEKTLFQEALERALDLTSINKIYVVGGEIHRDLILGQIGEMDLNIPLENILLEPEGKNTLPAICWATWEITKKDENAKVLVLPSDHMLRGNGFQEAIRLGLEASESRIVVFGIKPSRPHTGYGYIKPGNLRDGWYDVERFVEKPDYKRAVEYVKEGYFWNSGMFLFSSKILLQECEKFAPEIYEALQGDIREEYPNLPSISIDYGIMEKTDRAAVVPLEIEWSDMGNFSALYDYLEKDEDGNAVVGESLRLDSKKNLIYSSRLVAAMDISDLLVVDSEDALLVAPLKSSQKVRKVVEELIHSGDQRALYHTEVYRPWGTFKVLEEGEGFKVKRLLIYPGRRTSLQRHNHREEHWVVIKGRGKITLGNEIIEVEKGDMISIPKRALHRIENIGNENLEIIETQLGDYLGEDDIERVEDDFGRE